MSNIKSNTIKNIVRIGICCCFTILVSSQCFSLPSSVQDKSNKDATTQNTNQYNLSVEEIYDNLNHPWGLAWYVPTITDKAPAMLLTERNGSVWIVVDNQFKEITNLPSDVFQRGQGGWFDIAQGTKGEIYLSYARGNATSNATAVIVFDLDEAEIYGNTNTLEAKNVTHIFEMNKTEATKVHYGGTLSLNFVDDKQVIYLGLGERGQRFLSQDSSNHHGTTVAITEVAKREYSSKILSYGHRNTQGLYYDAVRKKLYQHEHGPKGGDEVNIVQEGKNYGWPVVSYGKEYGTGLQVGEGTFKQGMEEPLHYWAVSPALSGMVVYYGEMFSEWNGDIILGSLKLNQLYRLQLNDAGTVVEKEELLFTKKFGRIRAVKQGPNGNLYFITDEDNGKVYKISAKNR